MIRTTLGFFILNFYILLPFPLYIHAQVFNIDAYKTEVFIEKITPDKLSWNDTERENDFQYIIISADGPDIPSWIFTKYVQKNNSLYIFGTPPIDEEINFLEVLISATSLHSYRTKFCKVNISINPRLDYAKYEIRIRINNLGIEDILETDKQREFLEIFRQYFWTESKDSLYITYLAESQHAGFRLPMNPNETAGVVIHLGSPSNFSNQLYDLQNETRPLSKHCPFFSKRIAVERHFRPKNFIIDWCYFKLITIDKCQYVMKNTVSDNCQPLFQNQTVGTILKDDREYLIEKENVPVSAIFGMLVLLVIIPSVFLGFIIVSWLTVFMCIHSRKLNDPSSDDYFDTVFFVCEDFGRTNNQNDDSNNYDDDEPEHDRIGFQF